MTKPSPTDAAAGLRPVLDSYGLGPRTTAELVCVSENETYRVDDPDSGRVFALRVCRAGYQSQDALTSELSWIEAIQAERVIPVAPAVPTVAGDRVGALPDGRFVVLFEWLPGVEPSEELIASGGAVPLFGTLGLYAAKLHDQARRWPRPPGFTRFRWDFSTTLGPDGHWGDYRDGVGVGPVEAALFDRAAAAIATRLAAHGTGPDRFGLIHADMRLTNLLVDGGLADGGLVDGGSAGGGRVDVGRVALIDFDDCGFGWFGYDLAASLSFVEHLPQVPELVDAWVVGYRSERALTAEDEAELSTFIMLRRLLLVAWLGSHPDAEAAARLGGGFTADSADLAEEFLRGRG